MHAVAAWSGFVAEAEAPVCSCRAALYMPALVAVRFDAAMKAKYEALLSAGKPCKVALVAIMRKLLIVTNALLRDGRTWSPKLA